MDKQFARSTLSIAAEYAVTSMLCRCGMYAQLTLGHQKKTDILVFSESGELARVEVKAKRGPLWPNCNGISGRNAFLVFVDYEKCMETQRPKFFVLTVGEWRKVLQRRVKEIKSKHPQKRIKITPENEAVFEDELGSSGKPCRGMSIRPRGVDPFLERWEKIAGAVGISLAPVRRRGVTIFL